MTDHEAVVTGVAGDFVLLETRAAAACGSCKGGGCGDQGAAPRRFQVRNDIGARVGDEVIVSVPDGTVLKAAALSYLMPALLMIAGSAIATAWGGDGLPAVAGGVAGLAVGIAALRGADMFSRRGQGPRLALKPIRRVITIDKET